MHMLTMDMIMPAFALPTTGPVPLESSATIRPSAPMGSPKPVIIIVRDIMPSTMEKICILGEGGMSVLME